MDFREGFAVDLRALALLRIGLGLLLLIDLALRWEFAAELLGADGLFPSPLVEGWTLHSWLDDAAARLLFFGGAAFTALALIVGFYTRTALFISWLLFHSLCERNPWALDGGDAVLRLLLFWSLFLPVAEHFSWDARKQTEPRATSTLSFAGAALRLQVVCVYLQSVAFKLAGSSWRDGTALTDALSESLWARSLGTWIVQHASLAFTLNYLVLFLEVLGSILLLLPLKTQRARWIGIALLVVLQVGIASSLRMALFPWIMTLALIPSIPTEVFGPAGRRLVASRANQQLGAAFAVLAVVSAFHQLLPRRFALDAFSAATERFGLTQHWGMYAPNPYDLEFGLRVELETADGPPRVLDDGYGHRTATHLDALWADYRAGMYLSFVADAEWSEGHAAYAEWCRQTWAPNDPRAQVRLTLLEWHRQQPDEVVETPLFPLPHKD